MKLTKAQTRKLAKKLRVNVSAENSFAHWFLSDLKQSIGDKIKNAKDLNEVEEIIRNIDSKRLGKLVRTFSNDVLKKNNKGTEEIIKSMAHGIDTLKKQKAREKELAKGLPKLIKQKELYKPLMDKFESNMMLIKNLPREAYNALKKAYKEGKGFRGQDIEKELYRRMGNRARLIVRTESSKVNAALTEVRSRALGIKAYQWSSSEDKRVRSTHGMMNHSLVFWNDVPELDGMVGHCGNYPNCRCVSIPIVELEDIHFPVKVAEHIKITSKSVKGKDIPKIERGRFVIYEKREFLQKYGQLFLDPIETNKVLNK